MRWGSPVVEAGDEIRETGECGGFVGPEDEVLGRSDGPKEASGFGAIGEDWVFSLSVHY